MSNKTINDYSAAVTIDGSADYLLIEQSSVYKKINRNVLLGLASAPLGLTDSQSPTNKIFDNTNTLTIKDGNFTLQSSGGVTKQAQFVLSSITAGQTRTITVPDANITLVGTAATQTLTNKTLTSPTITGGTIDNSTITVDSIAGHTSATIVTVANLQISNGVLNTANAVTSTSVAAGAIQPQALTSGTGTGWAWSSWTPTLSNLTKGNGTVTSTYIQIGKTVHAYFRFVLGSTSAVGTSPTFTLPVTSADTATYGLLGNGVSLTAGATAFFISARRNSGTVAEIICWPASGGYLNTAGLTATVPGTWTTNDYIDIYLCYQAA